MWNFKFKKDTHMSEPSCFVAPSSDWLRSHCWSDVNNYEKGYKYECCNDSRYVERDYENGITYWKAWMAKQKILKRLFGTYEKSFQNMRTMLLAIKYPNPRTIIIWDYKMIIDNKTMSGRAF